MNVSKTATMAVMALAIATLALTITPKASAVPASELLRVEQNTTFQGLCCFSWLDKVRISEPAAVAPVMVTFSTD